VRVLRTARKLNTLSHLLPHPKPSGPNSACSEVSEDAHSVCARAATLARRAAFQPDFIGGRLACGYTIRVPVGTYRVEVELRGNETLVKQPAETHVNNGDLDPARDFVITVKPAS